MRLRALVPILLLWTGLSITMLRADQLAEPRRYKQYASNKRFYIVMIPKSRRWAYGSPTGEGIAYSVHSKKPLWRVNWYDRSVVLSDDGVHLMRFGLVAEDREALSDLAIAFYARGKEFKRYTVKDLIKNPSRLKPIGSFYQWYALPSDSLKQNFSKYGKRFRLALVDGSVYIFEVRSGKIISQSSG